MLAFVGRKKRKKNLCWKTAHPIGISYVSTPVIKSNTHKYLNRAQEIIPIGWALSELRLCETTCIRNFSPPTTFRTKQTIMGWGWGTFLQQLHFAQNKLTHSIRRAHPWLGYVTDPFAFVTLGGSFLLMFRSDTRAMGRVLDVVCYDFSVT